MCLVAESQVGQRLPVRESLEEAGDDVVVGSRGIEQLTGRWPVVDAGHSDDGYPVTVHYRL